MLGEWHVLVMSDTWVDEKRWIKVKETLPRGYKWEVQMAKRKNRNGRAMRRMMIGIRRELMEEGTRIETGKEGLMMGKVKRGKERWSIVGVYVGTGEIERVLQDLEEWIGNREQCIKTIVGGDFNARIGREGGGVEEEREVVEGKDKRKR